MASLKKTALALGLLLTLARSSHSYVTSAILEYFGDDKCGFYLNGHLLLSPKTSEYMSHWFGCLSTSDGTLPLEYFNNNGDNLLAAVNYDVFGDRMYMAYRLTVHHSNCDPVVVWGEPDKTKFLNIPRNQAFPAGWFSPAFDDSSWGTATRMSAEDNEGLINLYRLEDGHFKGLFGAKGFVPFLSHNSNGVTAARDTDLYRSHFSFPNSIGRISLLMNPSHGVAGQYVAFRVVPGRDAADFSTYQSYVVPPVGLDIVSVSNQGRYNRATRRLQWDSFYSASATTYVQLSASDIISASGWIRPEKALGPLRPDLRNDTNNVQPAAYGDAASFYPASPAWFKLAPTSTVDGPGAPLILGVIIRGQLRVGGTDNTERRGANQMFVNYSVDGSDKPALKEDAQFSHAANSTRWVQGYYDASEDRQWTWADISRLRLKVQSRQYASRQVGRLGSLWVTVRAYQPKQISPSFMAKVSESHCAKLDIKAGIVDTRTNSISTDSYLLPVNQHLCPSPTPRPTAAPVILVEGKFKATATPGPGVAFNPVDIGLGCMDSNPKPFNRGGVFINFCLKAEAEITIAIYYATGAKAVRTLKLGHFRSGDNQVFYNALDEEGVLLEDGTYRWQITATTPAGSAVYQSEFRKTKDKSR